MEELSARTGVPAPAIRERLVTAAVLSSPRRYVVVGSPADPLTVDQLRRWCVRDGFSAPQIAALTDTTARQVRYRLARYGLSPARPGPPAALRRRLTEPHLRHLYERERLSCPQIAARVGASTEAVRRLMVGYGIERRPSGRGAVHRLPGHRAPVVTTGARRRTFGARAVVARARAIAEGWPVHQRMRDLGGLDIR